MRGVVPGAAHAGLDACLVPLCDPARWQGNLISAGVFFFLSMAKENKSVIGSFTWMCCAVASANVG